MSEGVDLIDIYADEEFNQVRGQREHWDFPGSAEESLPVLAVVPDCATSPRGLA